MPRRVLSAVLVALGLCGCTATAQGLPPLATRTAVPADPTPAADPPVSIPDALDLPGVAISTHEAVHDGDVVTVEVAPGDRSFLLVVEAAAPGELVGIRRVAAPDGRARYRADLRRELVLVDELDDRVLADAGAVATFVAGTEEDPLPVGEWRVEVATNDTDASVRVATVHAADGPRTLDMVVWATAEVDADDVAARWRTDIDAVLAPHGIAVGDLQVTTAGEAGASHRVVGVDELADDAHAACTAADGAVGRPGSAQVVLVDHIGEGVLTAAGPAAHAYRLPDGDLAGFAASSPGTSVLGPASHGCVLVAAGEDPGAQGVVALHETLHTAGLVHHTTEPDGLAHDRLADTPECRPAEHDGDHDGRLTTLECPDGDNLMFWALGGTTLSADQAWRVRAHPLLRP